MDSFGCSSRSSPQFLRCGWAKSVAESKIPRFKVLSWHHRGSVWLRACHQRSSGLESGNRSIASLETQVVRRRWIPVQFGSHEAAALPLDACTHVVGCLGCGGAPNVHRCILNQ
ncbi:Hypothetical_protein [Hexamita inflata]|uniref:Hypothetical_protein n=1 Tax=Hexamita inflata TaxID=28002 RepID=A0AA86PX56_9EUKA|nr:Hypothetical protein HINF_LOCUS30307 [Hexamita inflata]